MSDGQVKKTHIQLLLFLSLMCYARIYLINSTFWDDNCWFLSMYDSNNLNEFMDAGGRQLRRIPATILTYYFISLHKYTEIYYLIFHGTNILTQLGTSLFLYLLVMKVFKNYYLSFCVALVALLYPIDTTTPIFSTFAYRIGLLFTVISLYFTAAALGERIQWRFIAASLFCTALAQHVFVEGAIALEPARLLIIWHLLAEREKETGHVRKTFLVIAGLFLVIIIPLVYFKLMYKPYGIYAGTYQSDPLFLLRWRMHRQAIAALFFLNWFFFLKYLSHNVLSVWSVVLGFAGALLGYLKLGRLKLQVGDAPFTESFFRSFVHCCRVNRFVFLLALAFYIPPVLMYEFAGRVVFTGVESRHGTLLVIGFALIWGGLAHAFISAMQTSRTRLRIAHASMALFIGCGVFFHNVNHDLYLASQRDQQKFWRAFTQRFPVLDKKSAFLFDVEMPSHFYIDPFYVSYSIELYLNMLYARSSDPAGFKNYIAAPVSYLNEESNLSAVFMRRHPGTGHLYSEREPLNVVKYEDDKLLVNEEILASSRDYNYKKYFYNSDTENNQSPTYYSLRHKLPGFYR